MGSSVLIDQPPTMAMTKQGTEGASEQRLPRVLFLVHRMPYPPDKGDRIRSYQLLRRLAATSRVTLACLADEPWSAQAADHLRDLCEDVAIVRLNAGRWFNGGWSLLRGQTLTEGLFQSSQLRRWITAKARHEPFDGVVAFCSSMGPYLNLPALRQCPVVVDLVDVDSEKFAQYAVAGRGWKKRIYDCEARRLAIVERKLAERAHAVLLVTEAEAQLCRHKTGAANVYAVGNGIDLTEFDRPVSAPARACEVTFVGAMDYKPNVEGALWFAKEVWPGVRRQRPEAEFRIVGRRPVAAIQALQGVNGMTVHANVPDVRPYLWSARAALAPLHVARGVQNKVLEALACRTPVIATSAALEGLAVSRGVSALEANHPDEWISAVVGQLQQSDHVLKDQGEQARRDAIQHGSWESQLAKFDQLLQESMTVSISGQGDRMSQRGGAC